MPLHQRLPRGARWLADMRARLAAVIDPGIATKAAHRPAPLVAIDGPRQPVWAPRDYAAFAREGFMQNAIVYRSVRMIAEATASVPMLLYERDTEIEEHPILDLLRRPSPAATTHDLVESLAGFLLVSGNGFIEAVGVGDEVRELHVLRPDRVKVIPGPDGWPQAWEYAIDGRAIRLAGEAAPGVPRVLHMRLFHPVNDHYGMSPIEAAAAAIDLHNTAQRWNKALLDNSARPSGALVYTARDGNLTTEQYDRLKRELENGFQGALNAGRPLLLEGGLDWKSMSLTPKDMDFIEARNAAAREIALALGVPPMLLGIPGDATYANYQEANRTFWRQTVLPLATRVAAQLTTWLTPAFGTQLSLRCDLDQIEALAPERDALWTRLGKAAFLTPDEKRAAAGYGPAPAATPPLPALQRGEGGVRGSGTHTGLQAALKFNPAQPRVPAGSGRPSGRWTKPGAGIGIGLPDLTLPGLAAPDGEAPDPGGSDADTDFEDTPHSEPQSDLDSDPQAPSDDDPNLHTVSRRAPRTSLPDATPGQQARFDIAQSRAREATETLRQLDPEWRAPQSFTRPSRDEGVETTIRRTEDLAAAAEARLQELLRDAIPGTNPLWGVNRLREELLKRGFEYRGPARDSPGQLFENPATGEQIRIMERPLRRWGTDPPEKHQFEYYYRYRGSDWPDVGRHTPIPDKPQPK